MSGANKEHMKCKICGAEMKSIGFERKLIMRGTDKGKSITKDFYKCLHCKEKVE